jgi:GDP-L-fucose synthase
MADRSVLPMSLPDTKFDTVLGLVFNRTIPPVANTGSGEGMAIRTFAEALKATVGFQRNIVVDLRKQDGATRKEINISKLRKPGTEKQRSLHSMFAPAYEKFLEPSLELIGNKS